MGEIVPLEWRFLAQAYVFVWGIPGSGLAPAISYAFIYQTKAGWRGYVFLFSYQTRIKFINDQNLLLSHRAQCCHDHPLLLLLPSAHIPHEACIGR